MITYAITVSNEFFEFKRLIDSLTPYLLKNEDIVILCDSNKVTDDIKNFCNKRNLNINFYNFSGNFSDFKNQLISYSKNNYIFQIDADEQIPPSLLITLRQIALENKVECLWIPRINIISGHLEEDVVKYNWQVNENKWINFPDFQARFFKNNGKIKWSGIVHEQITGHTNQSILNIQPIEIYSILHFKEIEKQRKQNEYYNSLT
jgi:glycosyltransferase involved in cell wall biosynthesis